jgi:hypothetical protein
MIRGNVGGTAARFVHDSYAATRSIERHNDRDAPSNSPQDLEHPRPPGLHASSHRDRGIGVTSLVGVLASLLVANVFVALFVSAERVVYWWDFSGYWKISMHWAQLMRGPARIAMETLLHSVAADDYNILPSVAIGSWMALVGESRTAYLLGIVNLYATGVIVMLIVLSHLFVRAGGPRRVRGLEFIPPAVALLVPPLWVPILRGYLDVGGVAIALAVLWLYFSSTRNPPLHAAFLGIGLLLAGVYLFRRWYAFWVVSFLVVATIDRIALLCKDGWERGFRLRLAVRVLSPVLTMSLTMVLALAALALPVIRRVATTDYSDMFSAYKHDSNVLYNMGLLGDRFGWAFLCYALISVLGLVAFRETRRMSLFLFLQAGLTFFHFSSVQGFGLHHFYLLMPSILLLPTVFTMKLASLAQPRWTQTACLLCALVLGMATTAAAFCRPASLLVTRHSLPLPLTPCLPLTRNDLPELTRMFSVLDGHLQESQGRLYVLGASDLYSLDTFINAPISLPVSFRSADRVIPHCPHVDKRDGFPRELLNADLVAVATPIQYALRPSDQQVVGLPAESFLQHRDIGCAFEALPESFLLENGVKVLLFRKTRPIEAAEAAQLSERFRAAYPDRPDIYCPS